MRRKYVTWNQVYLIFVVLFLIGAVALSNYSSFMEGYRKGKSDTYLECANALGRNSII